MGHENLPKTLPQPDDVPNRIWSPEFPAEVYSDLKRNVRMTGVPLAGRASGGSLRDNVADEWNDPDALARILDHLEQGNYREVDLDRDDPLRPVLARIYRMVIRARLHALAQGEVTPRPAISNDFGTAERDIYQQALQNGASIKEAISAALRQDADDQDADVKGPLATGEVDLGLRGVELAPAEIPRRAREIIQGLGLTEDGTDTPTAAPTDNPARTAVLGLFGLAAAIATLAAFLRGDDD